MSIFAEIFGHWPRNDEKTQKITLFFYKNNIKTVFFGFVFYLTIRVRI